MTLAHTTIAAVRKTVLVNAPQAHAFTVFTERLGEWWPLQSHHIGSQPAAPRLSSRAQGDAGSNARLTGANATGPGADLGTTASPGAVVGHQRRLEVSARPRYRGGGTIHF